MSDIPQASGADGPDYDPIFLHSRREAILIFCVWLAALLWAVPYCYINGYVKNIDPENFSTIWGMPSWVFGGILLPWLVADVFTTWFCFFYMENDSLGEVHEGLDIEEEVAEMHAAEEAAGEGADK